MATHIVDFFPAGYLTKEQVKTALACSDPTIERMVRDSRIGSKLVPRQGRKAERMYLAEDVDRLKQQREKREALRPPPAPKLLEAGGAEKAEVVSIKTGFPVSAIRELIEEWAGKREEVGLREKLWLTWEEAAELSGIPVTYVREAAHAGSIKCKRFGRSWRVQRKSLEAFEG